MSDNPEPPTRRWPKRVIDPANSRAGGTSWARTACRSSWSTPWADESTSPGATRIPRVSAARCCKQSATNSPNGYKDDRPDRRPLKVPTNEHGVGDPEDSLGFGHPRPIQVLTDRIGNWSEL